MNEHEDGYIDPGLADENALNDAANPPETTKRSGTSKWDCLVLQLADLAVESKLRRPYLNIMLAGTTGTYDDESVTVGLDRNDPTCMAHWLRKAVERELERRRR